MTPTPIHSVHEAAEASNRLAALEAIAIRLEDEIRKINRHPDIGAGAKADITGEIHNALSNTRGFVADINEALADWSAVEDYGSVADEPRDVVRL